MKKSGFALVELLAILMIIVILAAISWPMYHKAVLKSRYHALSLVARPLADAQEVFLFANGEYTQDRSLLDVAWNEENVDNGILVSISDKMYHKFVLTTRPDIHNNFIIYQQYSPNFPGEIHCEAEIDNDDANWLCEEELNGTLLPGSLTEGYNEYVVEGTGNGTPFTTSAVP